MVRRIGPIGLWRYRGEGNAAAAITLYTPWIIVDVLVHSYGGRRFEVDLHRHEFAWAVFGVHAYRRGIVITLIKGPRVKTA